MFDSIDLSSIDDLFSHDSTGGENDIVFDSELNTTEDFLGKDDTSFGTETTSCIEHTSTNRRGDSSDFWSSNETSYEQLNSYGTHETSTETIDTSQIENEITFKGSGYSQNEINNHISKAKHDIADAESCIRHHTSIADSKIRMGEPHSYEDYQIKSAIRRLNDAKSDLSKWERMKPSN